MRRFILSAVVLLCACPPGSTPDDGGMTGGDAGSPAEQAAKFCDDYATVRCAMQVRCGRARESERTYCQDRERAGCMFNAGRFVSSNASLYLADAGPACLAKYAAPSCDDYSCEPFINGGALGSPCSFGIYCREGFCKGGGATCAACGAFQARGATCDARLKCGPDDYCNAGQCVARLDGGQPCTQPNEQQECRGNFICVSVDAGALCGPLPDGVPCAHSYDCAGFCSAGHCASRLSENATCDVAEQGCQKDLYCIGGQCRRVVRDAGVGQSCLGTECAAGLWCRDDFDGGYTCATPGTANAVCQHPDSCAPAFECTNGTCKALGAAGDNCPCLIGFDCPPPSDGGTPRCKALPRLGEACDYEGQCVASQSCYQGRCRAFGQRGDPCDTDFACESYACGRDGGANTCGATCF